MMHIVLFFSTLGLLIPLVSRTCVSFGCFLVLRGYKLGCYICLWGTWCTSTYSNSPIFFLTNSRYTERYSSLPWNSPCTWDSTSWKIYTNLILLPLCPLLVYVRLEMLRNSFDCWMLRMTTQRYFDDEYSSILVYYEYTVPSRVGWSIHVDDQILLVFLREKLSFLLWSRQALGLLKCCAPQTW